MPVVSVTRFRARSLRFLPFFAYHAQRSIAQVRRAEGFIAGGVRRDSDLALWTMTTWRDEQAMHAYVVSGAHRKAMARLPDWGEEASTVRWTQDDPGLPDWTEAERRMRRDGRALPLRRPGPDHARLGFPEARASQRFTI